MVRKLAVVILVFTLSGCSTPLNKREHGAIVLGLWGAMMGAQGKAEGAAIGAVVGALFGALLADAESNPPQHHAPQCTLCNRPPQQTETTILWCEDGHARKFSRHASFL